MKQAFQGWKERLHATSPRQAEGPASGILTQNHQRTMNRSGGRRRPNLFTPTPPAHYHDRRHFMHFLQCFPADLYLYGRL